MQHIGILETADLLRSRKDGRTRMCAFEPRAFQTAEQWLSARHASGSTVSIGWARISTLSKTQETPMEHRTDAHNGPAAQQPPPLRLSRTFHAPPQTVFKAWRSAEHVKHWFSPETYSVSHATVEMHIGGAFDVCMRSPSGVENWIRGSFVEVTPYTRLVIDMRATDGNGEPLFRAYTEVNFARALEGTRIDVVQAYTFIDPTIAAPMVAGAPEGWRTTLDKLEAEVVAMQGRHARWKDRERLLCRPLDV
jgi:uncharacterized protein YndB with AHSA1/START domain